MSLFGQDIRMLEANRDFKGLFKAMEGYKASDAIAALGRINDTCAVEPLISLLNREKNCEVRILIIKTLAKLSNLEADPGEYDDEMMEALYNYEKIRAQIGQIYSGTSLPGAFSAGVDGMLDHYISYVRELVNRK